MFTQLKILTFHQKLAPCPPTKAIIVMQHQHRLLLSNSTRLEKHLPVANQPRHPARAFFTRPRFSAASGWDDSRHLHGHDSPTSSPEYWLWTSGSSRDASGTLIMAMKTQFGWNKKHIWLKFLSAWSILLLTSYRERKSNQTNWLTGCRYVCFFPGWLQLENAGTLWISQRAWGAIWYLVPIHSHRQQHSPCQWFHLQRHLTIKGFARLITPSTILYH